MYILISAIKKKKIDLHYAKNTVFNEITFEREKKHRLLSKYKSDFCFMKKTLSVWEKT